jgi:hypothetical protein
LSQQQEQQPILEMSREDMEELRKKKIWERLWRIIIEKFVKN